MPNADYAPDPVGYNRTVPHSPYDLGVLMGRILEKLDSIEAKLKLEKEFDG